MPTRMSLTKVKVLGDLEETRCEPQYGYGFMRATGVKSGKEYTDA